MWFLKGYKGFLSSGLHARNTFVRSLRTGSLWSSFTSPLRSPNALSSSSSFLSKLLTSHRGVIALRLNLPRDQRPEWSLIFHPTNLRLEIETPSRHPKRALVIPGRRELTDRQLCVCCESWPGVFGGLRCYCSSGALELGVWESFECGLAALRSGRVEKRESVTRSPHGATGA